MKQIAASQWKLTLFPKLVIAFLLVIAPLYGIGLTMNTLGKSTVEDELSKSLKSRADFYLNSLEVENEHMNTLLQENVVDQDLQHITYLSGIMPLNEWSDTVRRIQNKLQVIKSSSTYITGVEAHILTIGRTLSSEASITDQISEDYEAVSPVVGRNGSGIYYWHNRMFIGIAYPDGQSSNAEPGFVLSIELDLQALTESLDAFGDYTNSGAALFQADEQMQLASNPRADILAPMKELVADAYAAERQEGIKQLAVGGNNYLVAYIYSPALRYYISAYMPTAQILSPINTYRNLLWLLSFISLVIVILYSYWIYRLIHKPMQQMIKAFRKVEQGKLEPMPMPRSHDEFLYLFQRFNMMMEKLQVLIHEVYEQKIRAKSSELKQLQAQINPHFLYNTYFILYRLAKMNDTENVIRFSHYLGEYFQYITRSAADEVPLEKEIKHARTYTEIQRIRFMGRIQVEFDELPEENKGMLVPRLILQPIIENAYKYGLEAKRRNGLIVVGIDRRDGFLYITVEDNGEQLKEDHLRKLQTDLLDDRPEIEHTGLLNVNRRLQIRFGPTSGVTVEEGELGGLKVTVKLPLTQAAQPAALPEAAPGLEAETDDENN